MRLVRAAVRAAQRRLLAVHAVPPGRRGTRPGGPTSSSAGTEAGRGRPGRRARRRRAWRRHPRPPVVGVLDRLRDGGHAAYLVGGSLRDALLRREPADWDLATDARPERPRPVPRRRVREPVRHRRRAAGRRGIRDHHLPARARLRGSPAAHRVEFGDDLEADLARRDFTVNAMAWGRPAIGDGGGRDARRPVRRAARPGGRHPARRRRPGGAVSRGRAAHGAGGPPGGHARLAIEAATLAAIAANAGLVAHVSGERVGAELRELLEAPRRRSGCAARRTRACCGDRAGARRPARHRAEQGRRARTCGTTRCGPSTRRPADRPIVRLAALLHDIGKPATLADGRFHHHDVVGRRAGRGDPAPAPVPEGHGRGRRPPRPPPHVYGRGRPVGAAVRRFIRRIGRGRSTPCSSCAGPTTSGSGLPPDDPAPAEFRARIDAELAARPPLDRGALAVDGDDLTAHRRCAVRFEFCSDTP